MVRQKAQFNTRQVLELAIEVDKAQGFIKSGYGYYDRESETQVCDNKTTILNMLEGISDMMTISEDSVTKADKIVDEFKQELIAKKLSSSINDFETNVLKNISGETVEKFGGMTNRTNQWTRVNNFIGNGPFKLDSWEINKSLKVSRNELYWGNASNKINGIEFLPIDNELTQDRLFRSGGLHLANTVPTEKIKRYREERSKELVEHNYFGTYYYRINTRKYPLNNVKFRKALSLSIDRDLIVKSILKGNQKVSYSFTPPDEKSYNPRTELEFNPSRAKLLLKESGYESNSPPLEVLYNTSEGHQKIAQAIQEMWKKHLGLNVVLTNVDWKVYLSRETQGDFDISRAGWIGDYPDPFTFLDMMVTERGNNKTGWSNTAFDELLKKAASKISTEQRYELYEEAEKILIDELPVIPLYTYTRTYLLSERVKNWQKNILDTNPYQFLSLE